MSAPLPELRLAPEYECHPLWVGEPTSLRNVDPAELGLPPGLAQDLRAWAARHEATYVPSDPVASGFDSAEELRRFDADGLALWRRLRATVGADLRVRYFSPVSGWVDPSPGALLVESPVARERLQGIARLRDEGGPTVLLLPLLDDDAPYLVAHGGRSVLVEVRADALVAVQDLYRLARRPPDLGPVVVRPAMPADEATAQAAALLDGLTPAARGALLARAEADLDARVRPQPFERDACRAYRVLQLLGRVTYQRQAIDPQTWLTPLQAGVHASQVVSARPLPHLRLDGPDQPLGWVYRRAGAWVLDFSEAPDARRAERMVASFMRAERGQLPRVVGAAEGRPQSAPDGSLVLDGVVPRDVADPAEYLASLAAFCGGLLPCELVR